jgi:hypothetical protein
MVAALVHGGSFCDCCELCLQFDSVFKCCCVSRARSAQFRQSAMRYKGEELTGEKLSLNGEGARALNAGLLADDRVLQVMLPLRDGLTLAFRQH